MGIWGFFVEHFECTLKDFFWSKCFFIHFQWMEKGEQMFFQTFSMNGKRGADILLQWIFSNLFKFRHAYEGELGMLYFAHRPTGDHEIV